jgi:hypothetical protein
MGGLGGLELILNCFVLKESCDMKIIEAQLSLTAMFLRS